MQKRQVVRGGLSVRAAGRCTVEGQLREPLYRKSTCYAATFPEFSYTDQDHDGLVRDLLTLE